MGRFGNDFRRFWSILGYFGFLGHFVVDLGGILILGTTASEKARSGGSTEAGSSVLCRETGSTAETECSLGNVSLRNRNAIDIQRVCIREERAKHSFARESGFRGKSYDT